jgi:copper chaperone CopZ
MTCGGCVDKIESAIRKSEGVESIQIDLKSGIATVFGKPKREELERLIMSLGFQVVSKQE